MSIKPQIRLTDAVSIAFETNGIGYLGFMGELPGTFIRGRTEEEALSKVDREVKSYLGWLGVNQNWCYDVVVVQRHRSSLMIEDADTEILLNVDRAIMSDEEFENWTDLAWHSGATFSKICSDARLGTFVDEARIRKTFYGENPRTIQEIFDHVKGCQYYYLSRTRIEFQAKEEDFMKIRGFCLQELEGLYRKNNNHALFEVDNELWTLKKILRRFIWHDRIHGKAVTRILQKQKQLGMIDEYDDPFHFMEATP